jgi:hypothetical protein
VLKPAINNAAALRPFQNDLFLFVAVIAEIKLQLRAKLHPTRSVVIP